MPNGPQRTCPNCDNVIKNLRNNKKFCSSKCRIDFWMKNHPRVIMHKITPRIKNDPSS